MRTTLNIDNELLSEAQRVTGAAEKTALVDLPTSGEVLMHSMEIGELACGSLKKCDEILELLKSLPRSQYASDSEVLHLIETRKLMTLGIGCIDMHLLAATLLGSDQIWTAYTRLANVASKLNVGHSV